MLVHWAAIAVFTAAVSFALVSLCESVGPPSTWPLFTGWPPGYCAVCVEYVPTVQGVRFIVCLVL